MKKLIFIVCILITPISTAQFSELDFWVQTIEFVDSDRMKTQIIVRKVTDVSEFMFITSEVLNKEQFVILGQKIIHDSVKLTIRQYRYLNFISNDKRLFRLKQIYRIRDRVSLNSNFLVEYWYIREDHATEYLIILQKLNNNVILK